MHNSIGSIRRFAAYDVGSGKIKLQVAEVDCIARRVSKILFTNVMPVAIAEELATNVDDCLSVQTQQKLSAAIDKLKSEAALFAPTASCAVATEAFRVAKNGVEVLSRLEKASNIPMTLLTHVEEGELGYIAATAHSNINGDNVVCWDSGAGSFQMTAKSNTEYIVYRAQLGYVAVKNLLLEAQGKASHHSSPNPVTVGDVEKVIAKIDEVIADFPFEIKEKLKRPDSVVLKVGGHPLGGHPMDYDLKTIEQALFDRLSLSDEEIAIKEETPLKKTMMRAAPPYVVSNLLVAFALMNHFNIKRVRYCGASGGITTGILLSPRFWSE